MGTSRRARRHGMPSRTVGIAVIVGVLAAGWVLGRVHDRPAAAVEPHIAGDPGVPGTPVTASDVGCGDGWHGGRAGTQRFAVWNDSNYPIEVYLQDVATRKAYLDVENLGTGVTRAARVDLGSGTYEFVCLPAEGSPVHGDPQQVTGDTPAQSTAGVVPITANDLAPVVATYERWVRGRLPGLLAQTRILDSDVRRGDLAAARRDWLAAHLRYQRLGAAYGAFGDDDIAIDAMPSAVGDPARDRHLHGFHRIEAMLWTGHTEGLARETTALVAAVRHLREDMATDQVIQPIDVGLRAHEILEDSIGRVLTGMDDAGSHTGLATIDANADGTWHALRPLLPLLRGRDPQLGATERGLRRLQRIVRSHRHGDTWVPLGRLGRIRRERLDAALTQEAELLSRIAVITDPRKGAR